MNGNNSYWIHVWRLNSDNAQLIYRFPSSSWDTAWDSGYRLAYHRDQQFAVFRLDLGESFDIAGPVNETLPENAFSPKGNFLATQSYSSGQSAINVWDLHRGEFAFSVLDGTDAIWGTDVDRVAIRTLRTSNREIWSLEKKAKEQSVDLPIDPNPRNTSPDRILASVLESSFMRLAWLTARGDLIIRNIQTNRQNSIRLPELEKPLLDSGTVRWEVDGTLLVGGTSEFRWTQTESEVHGILTPVSTTALDANKPKAPLQFNNAFGSLANTPTLKWSDKEATDRKSRNPSNRRISDSAYFAMADTWIQSFDLNANGFPQGVPAHTVSGVSFGQRLVTFENRGKGDFSVSPDGKYCVDARFSANASSRQDGQELFLSTLTTSRPSVRLGVFAIDRSEQIIWQNGGPCVIVFENKIKKSKNVSQVLSLYSLYDTQKMEWRDLTYLNLPTKEVSQIIPYENRFLFVLKHSSTDSLQCWSLDPVTLKTQELQFLTSQLSPLSTASIFGVTIHESVLPRSIMSRPIR